jgi:hypothetical protein
MAKDKIVRALVTDRTFINGVLHIPGEIATVNLTALGVDKLGEDTRTIVGTDGRDHKVTSDLTPGLKAHGADADEAIEQVEIAAVAAHVPDPTAPQGLPPGTVTSGTGRELSPADDATGDLAREAAPVAPKKK